MMNGWVAVVCQAQWTARKYMRMHVWWKSIPIYYLINDFLVVLVDISSSTYYRYNPTVPVIRSITQVGDGGTLLMF